MDGIEEPIVIVDRRAASVVCPECGGPLAHRSGCVECPTCGFSICSS